MRSPTVVYSRRAALAAGAALALGGCSLGGRVPEPRPVTGDRSYPNATRPSLLTSVGFLADRLAAPSTSTVLLDTRPLRDHRAGHVEGARHVWWQDTMERNLPFYGGTLRPDDETGEQGRRLALLDLWGVDPSLDVVVYADRTSVEAARVVWFLAFLGFERVSMLDGGYAAWLAHGVGGVSAAPADAGRAVAPIAPRQGYYLVYRQVVDRLAEGNTVLLDIRTEPELRDTVGGTVRPSAIPGAVAWPWDELLGADGLLRPAAELSARAGSLGLDPGRRVVLVGRFGTDCALSWLALQLIGFPDVPTYDGGWLEWSTRPDASVAWL